MDQSVGYACLGQETDLCEMGTSGELKDDKEMVGKGEKDEKS
jgi:hypothetical protein